MGSKLFKRLGITLTGMALAIGVGVGLSQRGEYKEARAAEVAAYTLTCANTYSNTGYTAYASSYNVTVSNKVWSAPGNQNFSTYWRIGGKGGSETTSVSTFNRLISGKTIFSEAITSITVNHNGRSNAKAVLNSAKLNVYADYNDQSGTYSNQRDEVTLNPTVGVGSQNAGNFSFAPSDDADNWSANSYFVFTFNFTITGKDNYGLDINSIVFYKESAATLSSISLSPTSISGYVTGTTFDTAKFATSGVTVTAHYSDLSTQNVTASSTVTSKVLETGDNSVTISYSGKTATLTVNANTQDAYDTEAASTVTGLINTVLNSSNSGATYVGEVNAALDGYANLNSNAKSKVTNYTDLTTLKSNNTNYIIFNNNLASDSNALSQTPSGWWVPSSVSIDTYSYAYNGATDMAKLGTGSYTGSFKINVETANKKFGSIRIGVKKYSTDTGTVSVTGFASNITPDANGNESVLTDVSSSNLTEITIATTSKRAYITYVYFTLANVDDVLDASLSKTGTLSKTVYVAGESFDPTGLTISAAYNSGQNAKDVTNQVTWSPNPLTAGETSVTGTYTENAHSATITITGLTVNAYVSTNYGRIGQDVADLSGNYYLAYIDNGNAKVWNGDTTGAINSYISTTVTNNVIASTVALDVGILTITKVAGGYTMVNSAGKYIYASGSIKNNAIDVSGSDESQVVNIEVNNDGIASITFLLNTTTIYLRYNSANNQNKARFYDSESKVQGLTLFKAGATPTTTNIEDVNAFVSTYMHLNDDEFDSTDYVHKCDLVDQQTGESPYTLAKAAFNGLTAKQRAYFIDNGGEGETYEAAYNRLIAWATANHESLNGSTKILGAAISGELASISNEGFNSSLIAIIAVSGISVIAIGGYFFIRRRKEQ